MIGWTVECLGFNAQEDGCNMYYIFYHDPSKADPEDRGSWTGLDTKVPVLCVTSGHDLGCVRQLKIKAQGDLVCASPELWDTLSIAASV